MQRPPQLQTWVVDRDVLANFVTSEISMTVDLDDLRARCLARRAFHLGHSEQAVTKAREMV